MKVIKFNLEELKHNNDGFSFYIIGRSYDLEENDVLRNYNEALKWYEKGMEEDYPLCEYSLGISYLMGLDEVLDIDIEKGQKLLESAYSKIVELINSQETLREEKIYAKFVTGAYYYWGLGNIKKDYKKAFQIIKECADCGHIAAIYDLGANFYYNGIGTEKNIELAKNYLNLAKEEGLKRAIEKYKESIEKFI